MPFISLAAKITLPSNEQPKTAADLVGGAMFGLWCESESKSESNRNSNNMKLERQNILKLYNLHNLYIERWKKLFSKISCLYRRVFPTKNFKPYLFQAKRLRRTQPFPFSQFSWY
jgi:hypothetical protein